MSTTTDADRGQSASVVASESYDEWLDRTVDGMPEFSERQERELRELLRP